MASVKSGRCSHHRFVSTSGISPEMGVAVMLRFSLGDIQAVLAPVVNGRAVKFGSDSKFPAGTYNPSGESVALSSGARMGSQWYAGILGLFDPDRQKRSRGPAGLRKACLWQEIGLGQSMAEFAGGLAAIELA